MKFELNGKVYYRWVENGTPIWTTGTWDGGASRVSAELAEALEEAFMADPERRRVWGPKDWADDGGKVDIGWYMNYLAEEEKRDGKPYPAGNIEPNDAFHETGAHTPG